jgi:hypothetical protein
MTQGNFIWNVLAVVLGVVGVVVIVTAVMT